MSSANSGTNRKAGDRRVTGRHRSAVWRRKLNPESKKSPEQYQSFETMEYTYRIFVTSMHGAYRYLRLVLPSDAPVRKPDQGSQQRCWVGRASPRTAGR